MTLARIAALLVLAGVVLLLIPGSLDVLSGLGWMLEGFSVNLSLGETALSASMASSVSRVS